MKHKTTAILSAVVIGVGLIGGAAFAANINTGEPNSGQPLSINQQQGSNIAKDAKSAVKAQAPDKDDKKAGSGCGSALSKDESKDMIKAMRDNGFKDAARYMQTGDYDKMDEFMKNLSEEDYQKMIDIMKENGYDSMAQMMESIGREGMIQMHNAMSGMHSGSSGMMGDFSSEDSE